MRSCAKAALHHEFQSEGCAHPLQRTELVDFETVEIQVIAPAPKNPVATPPNRAASLYPGTAVSAFRLPAIVYIAETEPTDMSPTL